MQRQTKKQTEITDLVDDIIDEKNSFQNLGTEDIWTEDDLFNSKDPGDIIDTSKDIISDIKDSDPFLDFTKPTSEITDD